VVSGSRDWTVRLWDAESCQAVGAPMMGHTMESVVFLQPGWSAKWCLGGMIGASVGCGVCQRGSADAGHTNRVMSVPSARMVGSGVWGGHDDRTVRLWDAESCQAVGAPMAGHTSYVSSVSFSPDGRQVVSGSEDKTVRLWDAQSCQVVERRWRGIRIGS